MKPRFRLFQRASGVFYIEDTVSLRQESLRTKDKHAAQRLFQARNEAHHQPALNLQLARTYLAASDPAVSKRTWQMALDAIVATKKGPTAERWRSASRDRALDSLRPLRLLETKAEDLLEVLEAGSVSTNVYLRRLHNFVIDLGWLPWALLPKNRWPAPEFRQKRAITWEEHRRIVAREPNAESRAFYEMCWHLGGAQSDIANLKAEDIDWSSRVISYRRAKTATVSLFHFGPVVGELLRRLPALGHLFPRLAPMHEKHRAKAFRRRCLGLAIQDISLHSYRYAWAERAKAAGYPERYAMEALGHNSKAIHRAYARKAQVQLPSLESYENSNTGTPIVPFPGVGSETSEELTPPSAEGTKGRSTRNRQRLTP